MTDRTIVVGLVLPIVAWVAVGALLLVGLPLVADDPTRFLQFAPYGIVGGFLAFRRPGNVIGWLLIGIGFAFIGTTTPPWLDIEGLKAGTATARDLLFAWIGVWAGGASFLLYAALAMTFPTGHLPTGRWRSPAIAGLVIGVVTIGIPGFFESLRFSPDGVTEIAVANPIGLLPDPGLEFVLVGQFLATISPIAILACSVVGLVVRYRQAAGILRLQIRWLLAAMSFVVVSVAAGITAFVLSGETLWVAWIPALIAYPTVPLAVGFAVTRYRLFDIDRIISRTIGWALLSGVLLVVFAGSVLGLQAALARLTQGQTLAVATSTLATFALFQPVRRRIQRIVDRRFNRARYDQERSLAVFAAELRGDLDVDHLVDRVRATVESTVEPRSVSVWRREPSR